MTLRYKGYITGAVDDLRCFAFKLEARDTVDGGLALAFCDLGDCRTVNLPREIAYEFLAAVSPPPPSDDDMEKAA